MKLKIEIGCDNAAFTDDGAGVEVARILRRTADKIEEWPGENKFSLGLLDSNGNRVGKLEAK